MNRTVIYTAIFGVDIELYPQPVLDGIDFVCFSDRIHHTKGWKVVVCEKIFGEDSVRNNRFYKLNPHLFFQEYDYSIYMDGNFVVLNSPISLIKNQMQGINMLVFDHNQTKTDPRDCIYEEYEAILKLHQQKNIVKDDLKVMKSIVEFYKAKGYPAHNGLIKGGVLIRKHNEPDVIKLMERWWYFIQHHSKRDQLSFNFAAWEQGFKFGYLPGDIRRGNPWFYMVSKNDKSLNFSLFKYKLRQALSAVSRFF